MATAICGLEPGAPALGFWPLCPQKWFCTTFKKHHQKQNKMQFYNNANWLFGNGCTRRFRLNVWNTSTIFFAQPQIGIVRFLLPSCKPPDKMSLAFAVADFVLLCSCERYHVFRWWSTSSKVLPYFKHKKTNCCSALVLFSVGRGTSDAFWPIDGSGCMEAPQGWTLVWCQILVYRICKILKKNMPNKTRPNCFSYYYVRVLRVDSILGTGRETHSSWQLVWMFNFNVEVGSSFVELICPRRTCFFAPRPFDNHVAGI